MLIKKLFRTAWSYKAQFISMLIMIAIGAGVFLGCNIEWKSIEYNGFNFLQDTCYADYRIYSDTGFTEEDIEKIREIPGITEATRYLNVNADIKDTDKSVALNVSENYNVSIMMITEGAEYDEKSDGIWLSDKFADANNIKINDYVTLTYSGIEITCKVEGLAKSGENLICVADENQLMPDYESFGFAYITPEKLESAVGKAFYPQINIISGMDKEELEKNIKSVTGTTFLVTSMEEHKSYAGMNGEAEEGKTMGLILPVLFLAIGVLTMVTTMHRISANEKMQIGTLKALGYRNSAILWHYTSYGLVIGIIGTGFGIILGYLIAYLIVNPNGMLSTYLDMPTWKLVMPGFCIPVLAVIILFMTFISYISVKKMLTGTAADALRPYTPKNVKKSVLEKAFFRKKLSFGVKWNIRDVFRHKARSIMTLIGVMGCAILLVGGLGMKDTVQRLLTMLDEDVCNYKTKIIISESAGNKEVKELAEALDGDWQASCGISYDGETISLDIYSNGCDMVGFIDENDDSMKLEDDGVYLCLRLKDTAHIGDVIEISPYGSDETYEVRVAGYTRSLLSKCMIMTEAYADSIGIEYHIGTVYTDEAAGNIENAGIISGKQDKQMIMDSYDTFLNMMNMMIAVFVVAAVVLGIVVLYNLGVMNYVERYREMATLKVLGFRDRHIGKLLVSQNLWLTVVGLVLGIPAGIGTLYFLVANLGGEYEMSITVGPVTYVISILLTFGVSLLVGLMVSSKNRRINMAEALKGTE